MHTKRKENKVNPQYLSDLTYPTLCAILIVSSATLYLISLAFEIKELIPPALAYITMTYWLCSIILWKRFTERQLNVKLKWLLTFRYSLKGICIRIRRYSWLIYILPLLLIIVAIISSFISLISKYIEFRPSLTISDIISIVSSIVLTAAIVYLMARQLSLENPFPRILMEGEELILRDNKLIGLEVVNDSKHTFVLTMDYLLYISSNDYFCLRNPLRKIELIKRESDVHLTLMLKDECAEKIKTKGKVALYIILKRVFDGKEALVKIESPITPEEEHIKA